MTAPNAYSQPYGSQSQSTASSQSPQSSPNQPNDQSSSASTPRLQIFSTTPNDQSPSASTPRLQIFSTTPNDQSPSASTPRTQSLMQSSDLQQTGFDLSSNIKTNILNDDLEGHSKGWNPDASTKTFLISDSSINSKRSVVLINTVQSNFVVCSVDYLTKEFFEVNCNLPPANGAELHYLVFNGKSMALTEEQSSGNLTSRINGTAFSVLPRILMANPDQLIQSNNATSTNATNGYNNVNTSNNATSTNATNILK